MKTSRPFCDQHLFKPRCATSHIICICCCRCSELSALWWQLRCEVAGMGCRSCAGLADYLCPQALHCGCGGCLVHSATGVLLPQHVLGEEAAGFTSAGGKPLFISRWHLFCLLQQRQLHAWGLQQLWRWQLQLWLLQSLEEAADTLSEQQPSQAGPAC